MSSDKQIVQDELAQIDVSEMEGKYLTFWTDKQLFGIPIEHVVQIVGMQQITDVPEFPFYAKGIINLRGLIIPVIDIRLRFGKEERAYDERTCIVVTNINNTSIGFIVDEVDAVSDIPDNNISPPPHLSNSDKTDSFLAGIAKLDGKVVLLIEAAKVLSEDIIEEIAHQI